jgi:hypothetical protein
MTPAEIAAKLTKAQRAKILAIGNGQPREFAWGQSGLFLIERGFAFENELGARHLTDKGHAVRAHLRDTIA